MSCTKDEENLAIKLITGFYQVSVMFPSVKRYDQDQFNSFIRNSLSSFHKSEYFDNIHWIIIEMTSTKVLFIISHQKASASIDRIIIDLNQAFDKSIITYSEIPSGDYYNISNEAQNKGFEYCSTAWSNAEGKFDYIHELYFEE